MNPLARLHPGQMRAASAELAPCADCACAAFLSQEEVRDFCSLLTLADRVLIAGPDAETTAAQLLTLCLDEYGFLAEIVDARTMQWVQPSDTVVAFWGSQTATALMDLLRPALEARAILLAVTVDQPSALLQRADAAITLPPLSNGGRYADQGSPGFDLLSIIAVDAIRRDLTLRRHVAFWS
jgi:DNA-binding MurR/RpiR family transcriptional regulator